MSSSFPFHDPVRSTVEGPARHFTPGPDTAHGL